MFFSRFKFDLPRLNWRGLKSLQNDQEGVSAIEFALIAPLLVLLYFGGIELSFLMQADRRVTTVAATLGDLSSRATSLNNNDMADIFAASDQLLLPLDPSIAQLRISNLVSDASGQITVAWSDGCRIAPRAVGSSVANVPNNVVPPSSSIIMAEVEYDYKSDIEYLPAAMQILTDRFFLRPRRTDNIIRDTSVGSLPADC